MSAPGGAMTRVAWRSILAHKLRFVLTVVAVVLGTAFISGSSILTSGLSSTFNQLTTTFYANATWVASSQNPFVETVPLAAVDTLRESGPPGQNLAVEPVAANSGAFVLAGKDGKPLRVSASGISFAQVWMPDKGEIIAGAAPAQGQILLDTDAADAGGIEPGDVLDIVTKEGKEQVEVSGLFTPALATSGMVNVAFDEATYVRLFTNGQSVFQLLITGDITEEQRQLLDTAGPAVTVRPASEVASMITEMITTSLSFVNYFLWAFAAIALLVGSFIITNTFAMIVAQRTREFALLRAIGTARAQITRSVLAEAAIVGVLGSALGVIAGWGLVQGLLGIAESLGAMISRSLFALTIQAVIVPLLIGVAVTVFAAWQPARRAGAIHPVQAMRSGDQSSSDSLLPRTIAGTVLSGAGVVAAVVGALNPTGDFSAATRAWWVAAAAVLIIFGTMFAGPALARVFTRALGGVVGAPFGAIGRLAATNSTRNPRRTATTAFALTIGLALVASMGTLGATMKHVLSGQLSTTVSADFVATSPDMQLQLPFDITEHLSRIEGITGVVEVDRAPLLLNETPMYDGPAFASPVADGEALAQVMNITMVEGGFGPGVAIAQTTAELLHLTVGDTARLTTPLRDAAEVTVTGIYENTPAIGRAIIDPATARELTPDVVVDTVFMTSSHQLSHQEMRERIQEVTDPMLVVQVKTAGEYANSYADMINQMLMILYLLLGLAVLVAIVGIINTLALSVIERRREIGMLRAVGAQRRHIRIMMYVESVTIAVYGAIVGAAMGLFLAWAFVAALEEKGLGDGVFIPWGQVGLMLAASAVVGLIAAVWPAITASRTSPLEAIAS